MRSYALTRQAEHDLAAARSYYDQSSLELGNRFIDAILAAIVVARERPESCPVVRCSTRAVRCRRFPYRVYFRAEPERVLILAVYHTARNPDRWDDSSRA